MISGKRAVPLDSLIGETVPAFKSGTELEVFEGVSSFDKRVTALNTFDAIKIGAAAAPGLPALQFLPNASPDEEPIVVPFEQFVGRVTQAANLFHDLGVGKDDVVSILLPLLPQSFYALFGAQAAGIANPVNPLLEPHQLAEILSAAKTTVLVALGPLPDTDIWSKIQEIRWELTDLKKVVQVGGPIQENAIDFDQLLPGYPDDHLVSQRDIKPDDIAAYFHTGGTTGTPKLVRHTHRNQVYQAWMLNVMMPDDPGSTILFGLPLFHVGGALTHGLATLTKGASMVVLSASGWRNGNAIANVWKLVDRYKPTTLGGVPTVLTAASNVPIGDADISSLSSSSGGGSAIPVAVCHALTEMTGQPVVEVYGMTETASVLTLTYIERDMRVGSVGHPAPYSGVRIIKRDDDGNLVGDCAVDEIGIVAMSGPGVFSGYLNDEHNIGAFVEPGWVNSGDLGRLDKDGYLWITGRAKDLIIRGGHNIDPAGVEETFYQHPDVALVALVGQPDSYAGELPLAYVQLKENPTASRDDLLNHVREKTPERAAVPVDIIFIEEMPLTGVGKVFKPKLRWDAAERVFSEALAPVVDEHECDLSVSVGADGTHGTLATVTVLNVAEISKAAVARAIDSALGPFVLPFKVVFGAGATAK